MHSLKDSRVQLESCHIAYKEINVNFRLIHDLLSMSMGLVHLYSLLLLLGSILCLLILTNNTRVIRKL